MKKRRFFKHLKKLGFEHNNGTGWTISNTAEGLVFSFNLIFSKWTPEAEREAIKEAFQTYIIGKKHMDYLREENRKFPKK